MFDLNEFAQEIHQNAVAHGWWEGERSADEIIALIHSEWSEALEEYRAGRPLVWHKCPYNSGMCETQEVHQGDFDCRSCTPDKRKPEGIAVELIDGCIRILDFLAWNENTLNGAFFDRIEEYAEVGMDEFVRMVCLLHVSTSLCILEDDVSNLVAAMGVACYWIKSQGIDPLALMHEKHEYNKTRPYKHGGKVC